MGQVMDKSETIDYLPTTVGNEWKTNGGALATEEASVCRPKLVKRPYIGPFQGQVGLSPEQPIIISKSKVVILIHIII